MTIDDCQFEEDKPVALAITDADGPAVEATAELVSIARYPTHEARHFELRIADCGFGIVKVQLNRGDPGNDEARLEAIATDLLRNAEPGTRNREEEPAPSSGAPAPGSSLPVPNGGREA